MTRPGSAVKAVIRYRRPDPECWEVVVRAACNPLGSSWDAAKTVAQAGSAVSGHADRLAKALATRLGNVEELALALAGMGDLRALPALRRIAEDDRLPYNRPWAPPIAALPAQELLPAILPGLRRESLQYRAGFVLELLAAWGPAAAPAVPEAVRCLESPYAYDALRVLGRIGPPAAVAANRLAAYATGHAPRTSRLHQRRAAWAHWRVTGDPTLALDVCGAAVGSGTAGHGLPFLADLGPLAAEHADTVGGLMDSPGAWTQIAAAHAYWRITGDPEPVVPVLLAEVDPDWTGQPALPTREAVRRLGPDWTGQPALPTREAVRRLGGIGAPAAAAVPLLRRILASEERLSHPYDHVRVLADEAYVRTLTEALAQMGAGMARPVPAARRGLLRRWLAPSAAARPR
nr:hypothetical protein OG513_12900 [Streptomyces sp. NBC_00998]